MASIHRSSEAQLHLHGFCFQSKDFVSVLCRKWQRKGEIHFPEQKNFPPGLRAEVRLEVWKHQLEKRDSFPKTRNPTAGASDKGEDFPQTGAPQQKPRMRETTFPRHGTPGQEPRVRETEKTFPRRVAPRQELQLLRSQSVSGEVRRSGASGKLPRWWSYVNPDNLSVLIRKVDAKNEEGCIFCQPIQTNDVISFR